MIPRNIYKTYYNDAGKHWWCCVYFLGFEAGKQPLNLVIVLDIIASTFTSRSLLPCVAYREQEGAVIKMSAYRALGRGDKSTFYDNSQKTVEYLPLLINKPYVSPVLGQIISGTYDCEKRKEEVEEWTS